MIWSHCLIKETLKDEKSGMIKIKNISQKTTFKVLLEINEDLLIYEDEYPFYILGKNLPIIVGDTLEIDGYNADADSFDYSDETYQILNIVIKPIFNLGDRIKDINDGEVYKIIKIYKHYYDMKNTKDKIVMWPLIKQNNLIIY